MHVEHIYVTMDTCLTHVRQQKASISAVRE